MELDLDRVRDNVREAETEDLLDRATVYRDEMESEALTLIEEELDNRKVSDAQREQHRRSRANILHDADGRPVRCRECWRPAVVKLWRWHRLFGLVPVFPEVRSLCEKHQ